MSSTKSPSVLTSQLAVSTAIGSRLDIVASTHEIFEPLFIIEQHTVTQHPVVVVGEHVVGWAFWPQLQPTGNRSFVFNPTSYGILFRKKRRFVACDRKREVSVGQCLRGMAGVVQL